MKKESRGVFLKKRPMLIELIKMRSRIVSTIRRYLDGKGLIEVETPILCTHREGGPFIQFETVHPVTRKRFFLSFCPEDRLKRICSLFPFGVYEIARCFRCEVDDNTHLSEFAMLEVKQPNKTIQDQIELAFGIIQSCSLEIYGSLNAGEHDFSKYRIVTCDEIIKEVTGISIFNNEILSKSLSLLDKAGIPIRNRASAWEILDNLISYFVEPRLQELTFLIEFPLALRTISRVDPGAKTANRFQIMLNGIEIGEGGEKMTDPNDYRRLYEDNADYRRDFLKVDHDNEICEEFLSDIAIADPIAGFGIGIDRFTAIMLKADLNEIILFPRSFDY